MEPEGSLPVQNGRLLVLIVNEMSLVHVFPTDMCKIHFNIIHPSLRRSFRCFFPSDFPTKTTNLWNGHSLT